MTPEEQRIAIAEACGWKITRQQYSPTSSGAFWALLAPNGRCVSSGAKDTDIFCLNDYLECFKEKNLLPDYTRDLNAMHEAEKTLTKAEQINYVAELWKHNGIATPDAQVIWWTLTHATAAQRAEAWLRTKGLWKE